jgi:hypothetical protein
MTGVNLSLQALLINDSPLIKSIKSNKIKKKTTPTMTKTQTTYFT